MKIILAEHYGICFGVRDAIAEAEQLAREGPLTILGELVHNPVVREKLARQGVSEGALDDPASAAPLVMITAHGTSDRKREDLRSAGFEVSDGTCPLVKQAHEQLRLLVGLGYFPVVIGKPGHVEVQGLIGDFPEACVVESIEDAERLPCRARYGVISQTTQPIEKVNALVESIRRSHPESDVRFRDTVCQPTKNRQSAMRKLIGQCDTLVVIGGRNSNNTLQLAAVGRSAGLRVYHIERPSELEPQWFAESEIVGITAGTSTLKETVIAARECLEHFANENLATASAVR